MGKKSREKMTGVTLKDRVQQSLEHNWEGHLNSALLLIRNLRYQALVQGIDPRALRVALKYCMLVDTHLSKKHGLTKEQDKELTETARQLFHKTKKQVGQ